MAEYPALPLWTDAYLADCSHLTDAEHGRYFLMLQHMWRSPGRRFPNDDQWLSRKFCRSVEDIRALFRPLVQEFFLTDGNWLFHKRLEREWQRLSTTSRKQSGRAKSRWNKENAQCRGNATSGIATTTSTTLEEESLSSPPEIHITVPLASGPSAIEAQGELLVDRPASKPDPEPPPKLAPAPSSKGALWHEMATSIGGRDPRKLAGQWVRDYGLAAVAEAHWAAMAEHPADYRSWMKARLQVMAGERTISNKGRPPTASPLQSLKNNLQLIDEDTEDGEFDPRPSYSKTEAVPSYPRLVAAGN